jgi:dihydropyrimidinase
MPSRKIIQGGTIVSPEGTLDADLIIEGEKVSGIIANADPGPDDEVIDATGLFVLPGIVDAHTHIQLDTGIYQSPDNWEIGTKAAAAGGVTTVIDFATQFRGQTVDEALNDRFRETEPAIIDYGLHCMITDLPHGREEVMLRRLIERGVPSFKVYTTYRPNYYMEDATLLRLMTATREVGGLVMVHAENDAIVTDATERLVAEGKTGWQYHAKGRPVMAEWEAINRLAFLTRQVNAPVYIAHCTSRKSINTIKQAREAHTPIYCETCPQYLLLDDRVYEGANPEHYILQPPIRSRDEHDGLWEELTPPYGTIDVISTDSCDFILSQKIEHKEFTKTPGGLPGVETLLPLIYTYGVKAGEFPFAGFDLPNLVRRLCSNPAKIFGRYPRKGTLRVGSDADVALYDPEPEGTISHANLHYLAGYSPYEGMRVKGRVVMTLSRGEVVYQYGAEDEFPGVAGRGQFVPGDPFDAALMA